MIQRRRISNKNGIQILGEAKIIAKAEKLPRSIAVFVPER
jgi:hypothetical protein